MRYKSYCNKANVNCFLTMAAYLNPVCCLLPFICSLLMFSFICCLYLLAVVCHLLSVICYLFNIVCFLLSVIRCPVFVFITLCMLFNVCCMSVGFTWSELLSDISCITMYLKCILCWYQQSTYYVYVTRSQNQLIWLECI